MKKKSQKAALSTWAKANFSYNIFNSIVSIFYIR
jgi:hypothetical protein